MLSLPLFSRKVEIQDLILSFENMLFAYNILYLFLPKFQYRLFTETTRNVLQSNRNWYHPGSDVTRL